MATYNYSPRGNSLVINAAGPGLGTHVVKGFAKGSMISIEEAEDQVSVESSGDGEVVTFNHNPNPTGKLTITLDEKSPSNAFLNTLAKRDKASEDAHVGWAFKDTHGEETAKSNFSKVTRTANIEKAMQAGTRSWTFSAADLVHNAAGGTQLT